MGQLENAMPELSKVVFEIMPSNTKMLQYHKIKNVYYSGAYTVVEWDDKSKTKTKENDGCDEEIREQLRELAIMICFIKKNSRIKLDNLHSYTAWGTLFRELIRAYYGKEALKMIKEAVK